MSGPARRRSSVHAQRSTRARSAVGAMAVALAVLPSSRAAAGPSEVALRWEAPPGCPSERDVREQIGRMLAKSGPTAPWLVSAEVRDVGDRWRAAVGLQTGRSRTTRDLEASSCAALADAIALIVAVSVDPTVLSPPEAEEPRVSAASPERADADADADVDTAAGGEADVGADALALADAGAGLTTERDALDGGPEDDDRAASSASSAWGLQAGAGATFGLLPGAAWGLHAGVFGGVRRFGLRLDAHLPFSRDAGDDASFGALRLRAQPCVSLLETGRVHVAPCAGLEADVVWGRGRGVTDPRSSTAVFFAPLVSAHASVDLASWLALGASLDGALPIQRSRFELAGRPVFRVAPVLGGAHVEARVRW